MPAPKLLRSLKDVARKAHANPKFFNALLKDPVKVLGNTKLIALSQQDKDTLIAAVNKINQFDVKPLQEVVDAATAVGFIHPKGRLHGWWQQPWWFGRFAKRP